MFGTWKQRHSFSVSPESSFLSDCLNHKAGNSPGLLSKTYLFLALMLAGFFIPASGQTTTVFNCSSFSASGACAAVQAGYGNQTFIIRNGGALSGNQIDFVPANSGHNGYGLWYYTPVNIGSFTTTFTFIPNGQNIAFVVQDTNNQPGYQDNIFSSGAGCEAGFYQAFTQPPAIVSPNNLFALELDSDSWLTEANAAFTYSSAQIYQANQSPCLPNDNGPNYIPINKISTYPVPLNSPATTAGTTTGDVYSVTVTYDGTTLTLTMYDVTEGGACPGSSCFTQAWPVNIPSLVGGATAYVGFTAGINIPNLPALYVNSWSFTQGLVTPAAAVTFSPAAGAFTSTQSVALSSTSPGSIICYSTTGTPATNGANGCTKGTLYNGPISVSSSETVFAVAGGTGYSDSADSSAVYSITAPATVSTPVFTPGGGTYTSAQSVTVSDATPSATIYYTTNGTTPGTSSTQYSGPIMVSSTQTLEAIAVASGFSNSAVASAAYTITAPPTVTAPAFSPAAGSYASAQSVSISTATPGATVYYTTDGSTPSTSSSEYSGPIMVSSTETLQAMATAMGESNSAVATAAYTISSQPNFILGTSSPALTVNPGSQGEVTLTVTPENGFDSPVILACSGLPAGATCTFDQATVTPAGGAVTTGLTISSAQSSALRQGSRRFAPMTAMAMAVCLLGWRKRRGLGQWISLAAVLLSLGLVSGCTKPGGDVGTSTSSASAATTSMVTITAVSGNLQVKATIALTID